MCRARPSIVDIARRPRCRTCAVKPGTRWRPRRETGRRRRQTLRLPAHWAQLRRGVGRGSPAPPRGARGGMSRQLLD
eukprot:9170115-Pyramimonas_sp.AAC.1